jgi:hypothetical protein
LIPSKSSISTGGLEYDSVLLINNLLIHRHVLNRLNN